MPNIWNLPRNLSLAAAGLALVSAVTVTGCGSSGGSAKSSGTCTKTGSAYTLVAKDVAWNTKCLEVKRGQEVTVTVDNKDEVAHNLHITAGSQNVKTKLQSGPITQTLKVKLDKAGTFTFVCDIHPNMTGTLQVT